jgi:Arc/MetJ-type ribon-helix-helix transcriptional regulator
MKRTTVMLPDELAALLEYERRRRDVPASEIVREALAEYLTNDRREPGKPRFSFIGVGRSTGPEAGKLSENVEEILRREWSGDDLAGSRSR